MLEPIELYYFVCGADGGVPVLPVGDAGAVDPGGRRRHGAAHPRQRAHRQVQQEAAGGADEVQGLAHQAHERGPQRHQGNHCYVTTRASSS